MLLVLSDINLFRFDSGAESTIWTLVGVVLGAVLTGGLNYLLQKGQFKHNREMFYLQNLSREKAKELLTELLNHATHTDRKFETIRKRVGAFSDDELRILLTEVGGIKTNNNGLEYWYLKTREADRKNSIPEGYR